VPSPPCPSACPSGRTSLAFTACHVHVLRSHRLHVNRRVQVVAFVQRLRRHRVCMFRSHRCHVHRLAKVLAFAHDAAVSFTNYPAPSPPSPPTCPSGRSRSASTACHVRMPRSHRRHGHRLARVVAPVFRAFGTVEALINLGYLSLFILDSVQGVVLMRCFAV
jgi:hypothetical protein